MKEVEIIQGQTIFRFNPEDVLPKNGVMAANIVSHLVKEFSFQSAPQIQTSGSLVGLPTMAFSAGQIQLGDEAFGIIAIAITTNVIGVICQTTKASDAVCNYLTAILDRFFGFRFSSAKSTRRDNISTLVTVFDNKLTSFFNSMAAIETTIEKHRPKGAVVKSPFKFNRLGFGRDIGFLAATLEIDISSFQIERRAGVPYEQNTFFCTAPMSNEAHIAIFEEIERSL